HNPKGIVQQSPGLRGTSYPGIMRPIDDNPERVVSHGNGSATRPQPRWGCENLPPLPRVARPSQPWLCCRIPLGFASTRDQLQKASNEGRDSKGRRNYDIWLMAADGSSRTQLTTNGSWDDAPCWDHKGEFIYFRSNRGGAWNIWRLK